MINGWVIFRNRPDLGGGIMEKPVLVIGHRNPDTDSICAAIGYAYLKQKLGTNAIPARAGKINPETAFVLQHFGVPAPVLVHDLYPSLDDVTLMQPPTATPNMTLRQVGRLLVEHPKLKSIPVLDPQDRVLGIITVSDMARRYYNELTLQDLSYAGTTFRHIISALEGKLLSGDQDRAFTGKVNIGAVDLETSHQVLKPGNLLLVGDRPRMQQAALEEGVAGIVLTGGSQADSKILELARQKQAVLITTPYDTFTTARLVNQSVPVGSLMTKKVVGFKITDLLSDVRAQMLKAKFISYPVCEKEKYLGMIDRGMMLEPNRQAVILVDHNERSQAVEGIDEAKILEIIDHHRLGGLTTGAPIFIRQEPVGSSSTIVANLIWHRNIKLTPPIAGLLFSAIVSDTLFFRSPTTTLFDRDTAERLAKIAGIHQPEQLAMDILRHGSSLTNLPLSDIVRNDIKEFELSGLKISVSQLNVMDRQQALKMMPKLKTALEEFRRQEGYQLSLLMLTDILTSATDLAAAGEPQAALRSAFGEPTESGHFYLPGVLSRKKQIIPPLTEALKNR